MFKIVINDHYGSFGLSQKGIDKIKELGFSFKTEYPDEELSDCRNNQNLVQVVNELGREADGKDAVLRVVEIPKALADYYYIMTDDGKETVCYAWDMWMIDHLDGLHEETAEEWRSKTKKLLKAAGVKR